MALLNVLRGLVTSVPRSLEMQLTDEKQIQNELIEIIGEQIREKILEGVKQARFFSILADGAADVSNQEQLSLVLRFVDSSSQIREEFVSCTGLTKSSLKLSLPNLEAMV